MIDVLQNLGWSAWLQIVLMVGVLAYGLHNRLTKRPFDLLVLIFWMVCAYLLLVVIFYFLGTSYRGGAADEIIFGISQFLKWAMTIVLFAFLPMTLLAAWANKIADKRKSDEDSN